MWHLCLGTDSYVLVYVGNALRNSVDGPNFQLYSCLYYSMTDFLACICIMGYVLLATQSPGLTDFKTY